MSGRKRSRGRIRTADPRLMSPLLYP